MQKKILCGTIPKGGYASLTYVHSMPTLEKKYLGGREGMVVKERSIRSESGVWQTCETKYIVTLYLPLVNDLTRWETRSYKELIDHLKGIDG